jgi:acetone carboxylase gamma subunit
VDGETIFTWTVRKQDETAWTGQIWLRIGSRGVFCQHGDEFFHKCCGVACIALSKSVATVAI